MDEHGNACSVVCKTMEETPHAMLAGKGAYDFARTQGFPHENLLTQASEDRLIKW